MADTKAEPKAEYRITPSDLDGFERQYGVSRGGAERIAKGEKPEAVQADERVTYRQRYEKISNPDSHVAAVAEARQQEIDKTEAERAKTTPPAEHTAPESGPYTAAADYEEVALAPEAVAAETGVTVEQAKKAQK